MGTRKNGAVVWLGLVSIILSGCTSIGDETSERSVGARSDDTATPYLYIVMETTSDWTDFLLDDDDEFREGMITFYTDGCHGHFEERLIGLDQSIKAATNGNCVAVEAIVRIESRRNAPLRFGIMRGHLGETTVYLYEVIDYVAEPIGMYRWDGIDESDERNVAWFSVDWNTLPERHGVDGLSYPASTFDQLTNEWINALKERNTEEMISIHWPDATSVFVWPDKNEYEIHNTLENIREEFAGEPTVDYSLITYSPPLRIATFWDTTPKYVLFGSYDGRPSGCDSFWFEERDGEWRIKTHAWKIGVDVPPSP